MRLNAFAIVASLACSVGCATGGTDDAEAGDATFPADTRGALDAGDGTPRDGDLGDGRVTDTPAREGSIFDAIDDAPCSSGAIRTCTTGCGTLGEAVCAGGDLGPCKPRAGDPCSGLDCRGKGDGLEHTFYRDVDGDGHGDPGKPVQGCAASLTEVASKDDCDDAHGEAHPGGTEVCNRLDDDCNGKIDDGVHVGRFNVLYADAPPCGPSESSHAACKQGAAAWCRARSSCYDGGFGPVELGPSDGQIICISGGTVTGTWAEVTTAQPGCAIDAQADLRACESAVHRAAAAAGYSSGVLQTHSPGDWKYLALPADRVTHYALTWADLTAQHAGCYDGRQDTWNCNAAVHRYCLSRGHGSGYGPVEFNPTNVAIVCVNP